MSVPRGGNPQFKGLRSKIVKGVRKPRRKAPSQAKDQYQVPAAERKAAKAARKEASRLKVIALKALDPGWLAAHPRRKYPDRTQANQPIRIVPRHKVKTRLPPTKQPYNESPPNLLTYCQETLDYWIHWKRPKP
jgi:hypothetical protein